MKLIFEMPDGSHNKVLFPKVGEWQTGDIKDVDFEVANYLLIHHGGFIRKYEEQRPKKKKEPKATSFDNTTVSTNIDYTNTTTIPIDTFTEEGGED